MKDNTVKVIIVNGMGGCGKSTFVSYCEEYCEQRWENVIAYELSSVDFVKRIAFNCGWDGTKTTENRAFLHNLKTLLESWNDIPNKKVLEEIEFLKSSKKNTVFFVNIRENYNIEKFKKTVEERGYKCYTLIVNNKKLQSNEAPQLIELIKNYKYDINIENNKSLENLKVKAMSFMQDLIDGKFDKE